MRIERQFRSPTPAEEEKIIKTLVELLTKNNKGGKTNHEKPNHSDQEKS